MEKDNFNANVDFVRGQADIIVLSALSDSDKYGLEILSTIQERSQGTYSLKQATLYSSLKRLEKNGYVHSYNGDISNGAKRVYYGLTDIGRNHLDNDKSYWEFCNFLMSNLISDNKFDPQSEDKPFDPAEFRPLTRRVRGEKDEKDQDNEQDKEVVVKYVYVKDGETAPQGADVVYLPADQVQNVEGIENRVVLRDENAHDELSELDFDLTRVCLDEEQSERSQADAFEEYNFAIRQSDLTQIESVIDSESDTEAGSDAVDADDEIVVDDADEIDEIIEENADLLEDGESEENVEEAVVQDESEDMNQTSSFGNRPVRNQMTERAAESSAYSQYQAYSYENDVNYVGTFTDLFDVEDEEAPQPTVSADIEFLTMNEMVYKYQSKGISIKPYDKKNTMEYYVNRYYFSNKLHLHTSLIVFALLAVELFVSHFICNRGSHAISDAWLLTEFIVAIYPAVRGIMYVVDPTRKSSANYNPKTSILLSFLPVITLPIVFALIGFVEFGANINDYASMERPIILPSLLLFNVPLYSLTFTTLYRTYNYHIN